MNTKQILIVDDELIVARDTGQQLEKLGYNIPAIASNAVDAVRLTGQYRPDLILMDINLDGNLDGITAARKIQSSYNIPIIYVTALAEENVIQQARLTRPFAYIIKPYTIQDLHSNIQMALYTNSSDCYQKGSEATYYRVDENQRELIYHFNRDHHEEVLSTISAMTDTLLQPGNHWKQYVQDILANLVPIIHAEEVSMYHVMDENDESPSYTRQFHWASPNSSINGRNKTSLDFLSLLNEADGWFEKFEQRQMIKIDLCCRAEYSNNTQLIKSCILVPITILGKNRGFVGFSSRNQVTQWHRSEEDILKIAADIIGTIIHHHQADKDQYGHEKKLRSFINQSSDGIWLTDENCNIIEWNEKMEKFTGLRTEDVCGEKFWDVIYDILPEEQKNQRTYHKIKKSLVRSTRNGISPSKQTLIENTICTTDGSTKSLQTQYFSIIEDGVFYLGGIVRDLTEFEPLNHQVNLNNSEWEATFHSVSEMIILTDREGMILRCNQATLDTFRVDQKEMIGKNIDRVFWGEQEITSSLFSIQKETMFPNIEGTFYISQYPLYLENKRSGYVFIISDITADKEIENVINASQKLASLGTLAAGISHEINSPLQVIIGNSESLLKWIQRDNISREQMVKSLESIHRNGWRVAEIIRSLQVYAYSLSGNLKTCNLNELVRNALRITQHVHFYNTNRCIVTDLLPGLPELMCNEADITQVLINLISNAIEATTEGGEINISTSKVMQQEKLLVRIHDNGTGIPAGIRSHIFDPFYTTKPVGKGIGLGLSIAMGIVNAHGGEIMLENNNDKGSTFLVCLPFNPVHHINSENSQTIQGRFERFS